MGIIYRYKKLVVFLRNYNKNYMLEKLNKSQLLAYNIVKHLINKEDSVLTYAPVSDILYIQNTEYFIKIHRGNIMLINGKFYYDITLPDAITNDLEDRFLKRVDYLTLKMEHQITDNVVKSLVQIAKNLNIKEK